MALDVVKIREDFPILQTMINGKPLVYFDNAATTQKPVQVGDRILKYYREENSNVHRGVHRLSQVATEHYENARHRLATFIGAGNSREIIYTRGVTESMNMLAAMLEGKIGKDDEVVVTAMEHHSNLVPWQELCKRKKAHLLIAPVNENGELQLESLASMIGNHTKLVSVTHVSNVLGTVNPLKEVVEIAHSKDVLIAVDGAQALAHVPVNVSELDCDFYAGSAHKAYGPMGIGFLYGKEAILKDLPAYQYGGEMVDQVTFEDATFNELPFRFEAGTPNVSGAIGMDAALDYLVKADIRAVREYEDGLLRYATEGLKAIKGIRILGEAQEKTSVLSFVVEGVHAYDLGTLLDQMGIAVRTGYHCAQPLIESFGLPGTLRASLAMYNTREEVDLFLQALEKSLRILQ